MTVRATAESLFVGRRRELGELELGLEDATAGRGRLFLIGGEPGIGKSRLADELEGHASRQGARVLWGRCWEAGGAPAYWPWVQSIRSYVRDQEPGSLTAQLGDGASDVAKMIPELRSVIPDLREPVSLDPESARFRLFDSTTTFLRNASRDRPLVLIFDDLHAADAPSLLLLRFVAAEIADAHILIVGAYRDEELHDNAELATILTDVGRQQVAHQIRLVGLGESDVARFIEETVAGSPSGSVVTTVHRKTEGNPLFVGEVIRLLVAEGQVGSVGESAQLRITIPPRIREVIGRRLGLLSERCRRVCTVASVFGREARLDALAEVCGIPSDVLLEHIDEAVAARVLTDVPGAIGRMRFSHELIRDVLYEDLTTTERTRLHREIAETLEALHADDPDPYLAELAYHFCEAAPGGDVDRAVAFAERAGERAAALLGYEEGVRLFRLALQVLDMKAPADQASRCRLLLALGDSLARQGELEGAKATFLSAAGIARRERMSEHLAAAALGYGGRFVWARAGADGHLVPLLEEALDSLPVDAGALRARLMARLAGALRDQRSPEEQDQLSRAAVELARRIDDPATLSYTLEGRYAATWWPDNARERLVVATEMLQLAREADDGERISQAHDFRMCALMELGDIAAVDAELEAMAVLVERLQQPAQRWMVLNARVMRALFDGRFADAARLLPEAEHLGRRAQAWDAGFCERLQTFLLRREQGRLDQMEGIIRRSVGEYPTRFAFRCLLAHLYAELDRPIEARRAFDDLASEGFADIRRDNDWLFEMSVLPDVADFLGDLDRAAILYDLLSPYAGRHATTPAEASTGSISRGLGALASMLHRWDEATGHFDEALRWNAAMGARPWAAHTQHGYARMLLSRGGSGDRERAAALLADALATARELGMPTLERRVTALQSLEAITSVDGVSVEEPPVESSNEANVFRREGEYWSIRFEGDAFRLKDTKGLRYLAQLLGGPGREFLALDLVTAGLGRTGDPVRTGAREPELHPDPGGAAEILDGRAKAEYRRRLDDLRGELAEAEGWNDPERAARAREEIDFLARELAGAVGLGGRDRRTRSDVERARVNVTKAIKAATTRIDRHSPALARHLAATVRTGTFCTYLPDPRLPVTWRS